MIIFKTERLIVRQYKADEKDFFFMIHGDEEIMRYVRPAKTRTESDISFDEVLKDYIDFPELGRWAVETRDSGEFAGSFTMMPVPNQPEKIQLGYALLKMFRRKGFATELTVAGIQYAFTQLELDRIYGLSDKDNLDSKKVLLKSGFSCKGVFSIKEKSLNIYSISKDEWKFAGTV
ncbi:MAG: GNAT family N-acetyltransferase [Bacteroidetes bacterium]|nr:GNAT family N-acetyltransferase [Bacteroidota bacterium]